MNGKYLGYKTLSFVLSAARQRGGHAGPAEPDAGRRRPTIHVSVGQVAVNSSGSTPRFELINHFFCFTLREYGREIFQFFFFFLLFHIVHMFRNHIIKYLVQQNTRKRLKLYRRIGFIARSSSV